MARYIDIEGAGIGKANREQFLVPEFADGWNAVLKILEKEPTADVVEVKHGEWIEKEEIYGDVYYTCSNCNNDWTTIDGTPQENFMNFCPYCGADMRGGKNGL